MCWRVNDMNLRLLQPLPPTAATALSSTPAFPPVFPSIHMCVHVCCPPCVGSREEPGKHTLRVCLACVRLLQAKAGKGREEENGCESGTSSAPEPAIHFPLLTLNSSAPFSPPSRLVVSRGWHQVCHTCSSPPTLIPLPFSDHFQWQTPS